jgi:hypothetical protein
LGTLLGDTRISSTPTPEQIPADPASASPVSAGLGTLLQAGKPAEAAEAAEPGPVAAAVPTPVVTHLPAPPLPTQIPLPKDRTFAHHQAVMHRFPRWPFFLADTLLVGLAIILVWRRQGPLSAWEVIMCFSAIALGAWLTCAALLYPRK